MTYNVKDSGRFEFGSGNPLELGWKGTGPTQPASEYPAFVEGATQLQRMVDEFNQIGLPAVEPDEFELLVSRPARLLAAKIEKLDQEKDAALIEKTRSFDLSEIEAISKRLMRSPYTVHQSSYYNEVALLFQLYRLENGEITIDQRVAERLARRVVLNRPDFDLDELKLWDRTISADEVAEMYSRFFPLQAVRTTEETKFADCGCVEYLSRRSSQLG